MVNFILSPLIFVQEGFLASLKDSLSVLVIILLFNPYIESLPIFVCLCVLNCLVVLMLHVSLIQNALSVSSLSTLVQCQGIGCFKFDTPMVSF